MPRARITAACGLLFLSLAAPEFLAMPHRTPPVAGTPTALHQAAASTWTVTYEALTSSERTELSVTVSDGATGKELPIRAIVTAADGTHPDGSGRGVYADGRFFAEGSFIVTVPVGATGIILQCGPDYVPLDITAEARRGQRTRVDARLHKWFGPEERGWYGGDNHVHTQHDEHATIRTDLAYTSLQCRANGLSFVTQASAGFSDLSTNALSTSGFLFRSAAEARVGPYAGHMNTPGIRRPLPESVFRKLDTLALPCQALTEVVHEAGGAITHTHPFAPPHQLHWMGAAEFWCDAVSGRCADALDIDSRASEMLWFAALNLGNHVACSGYTDSTLERPDTLTPGDRRVYCRAPNGLNYTAVIDAIRHGHTFATNGGPIFAFLTIDGHDLGDRLQAGPAEHVARIEVHSLHPLKSVELYRCGNPIGAFDSRGKKGVLELTHRFSEPDTAWYVLRAEDERGYWAITSPIYFEREHARPNGHANAILLEISNATRYIELRRSFYAHIAVTVSAGESLGDVELLRDGEVEHRFVPADGDHLENGLAPMTASHGDYSPGWLWFPSRSQARHLQADWPVTRTGWYEVRAHTATGREIVSDAMRFDASEPNSRELSVAQLVGPGTTLVLHGYGEEMPLSQIETPFEGDHWWYPDKTYWRLQATFGGRTETVGGGDAERSAGRFRAS